MVDSVKRAKMRVTREMLQTVTLSGLCDDVEAKAGSLDNRLLSKCKKKKGAGSGDTDIQWTRHMIPHSCLTTNDIQNSLM